MDKESNGNGGSPKRQIPEIIIKQADKEAKNDSTKKVQINQKQPGLGLWQSIHLYFREYCLSSSLHGIRYLGEKGRTKTERVWWSLILLFFIWWSADLIIRLWNAWGSTKEILSYAEILIPIWHVPFPAVTICSETKVRQSVYNFTEAFLRKRNHENFTEEEEKLFSDISLICDSHFYTSGANTTDQSAIDSINKVAPDFEETLMSCKWLNKFNTSCKDLFSKSLTEEGLCYTFNMLDSKEVLNKDVQNGHYLNDNVPAEWSLEKGYKKGSDMNVYPRRPLGSGIKSGLTILLRAFESDLEYICKGPIQGFKILLHNPEEVPRVGHQYFRAPLNQEVIVAVQPDIITTAKDLKNFMPAQRLCYFPDEKKLRYFNIYTQQNCEVECLTNYTLNKCDCVAFHMPRTQGTPICGPGRTQCVAHAQNELLLKETRNEVDDSLVKTKKTSTEICKCLPGCTFLAYNAETSQADFNRRHSFLAFNHNITEFPFIHMTRVNIFFKDSHFINWHRINFYNESDFLATCGGILGLFMGFSFISLIEIVYFLTLRLWCNVSMHGRRMWNADMIDQLKGRHTDMHGYN